MLKPEQLDTSVWFNWEQPAVPLLLDLTLEACAKTFREIFSVPFFTSILIYTPGDPTNASWLLRVSEGEALGRTITDLLAVPSAADRIEQWFHDACGKIETQVQRVREQGVSPLDLRSQLQTLRETFLTFYALGAITEPVEWFCEQQIGHYADSEEGQSLANSLSMTSKQLKDNALAMAGQSWSSVREQTMLELASYDPAGVDLHRSAEQLASEYWWHATNYARVVEYTQAEAYTDLLKVAGNDQSPKDRLQRLHDAQNSGQKNRAVVLRHLPDRLRRLSVMCDRFGTSMADHRKKVMNQALYAIDRLARDVATSAGLSAEQTTFLSPTELCLDEIDVLELSRVAGERTSLYVELLAPYPVDDAEMTALLELRGGSSHFEIPVSHDAVPAAGENAAAMFADIDRRLGLHTVVGDDDSVSGEIVTVPGLDLQTVAGRCVIVTDPRRDSEFFSDGDILIATSTTPDFVPLMSRAGGVVTCMGGLLQHAAIIAREKRIPCIVGTGYATSAFSTGDHVMMNMTTGSVDLVTRAEA